MGIGFKYVKKEATPAVFITTHGGDDVHSVFMSSHDFTGRPVNYIRAGQILVKIESTGFFLPVIISRISKNVSSENDITIDDVSLFKTGDIIEIGSEFRKIEAINERTRTITINGDPITESKGGYVIINHTYNAAVVTHNVTGSGGSTTVKVSNAMPFAVNKKIQFNGTSYDIESRDILKKEIVISDDLTLKPGDVILSSKPEEYKIAIETVHVDGDLNICVPTRDHGRVRQSALIGFLPSMKKHFPLIIFDERTF